MGNLVKITEFENREQYDGLSREIEKEENKINDGYKSEIRMYKKYCEETSQNETLISFVNFLQYSLEVKNVKKTTWEKRVTALKRYFTVNYKTKFNLEEDFQKMVTHLRYKYNSEEYLRLKTIEGKRDVDKESLLEMIEKLPTREKAICLVNLITANRPSEMVRLKVRDFNLEGSYVLVTLIKQNEMHEKRLTPEAVKVVKHYIKEFNLKDDDFFVGRTYKSGKYESKQISEEAYRQLLNRTTGLSPYNFRKTQVSNMHEKGADLSSIAKQTGHKSTDTIEKHYLNVSDKTIDKYL